MRQKKKGQNTEGPKRLLVLQRAGNLRTLLALKRLNKDE